MSIEVIMKKYFYRLVKGTRRFSITFEYNPFEIPNAQNINTVFQHNINTVCTFYTSKIHVSTVHVTYSNEMKNAPSAITRANDVKMSMIYVSNHNI